MRIARRFNAGSNVPRPPVPKGRVKQRRTGGASGRPFGTWNFVGAGPGVETPGYSRDVPSGQNHPTPVDRQIVNEVNSVGRYSIINANCSRGEKWPVGTALI